MPSHITITRSARTRPPASTFETPKNARRAFTVASGNAGIAGVAVVAGTVVVVPVVDVTAAAVVAARSPFDALFALSLQAATKTSTTATASERTTPRPAIDR